jgi:hypothetical protein
MLPGSKGVHEFDVHHLGGVFFGEFKYAFWGVHCLMVSGLI